MALLQHLDDKVRFDQQLENSETYVLPFISATKEIVAGLRVLEIGCGEGGVLKPFIDRGAACVGVDLAANRIELAKGFLADDIAAGKVEFLCQNIYNEDFLARFAHSFDLIILKDVIEHVPGQEQFIPYLKKLLRPGGQVFFGFPPWYMPFGGHQQVGRRKLTSKLPYYHILPKGLYRFILKTAGEPEGVVTELMEIWDTRITIERFERIVRKSGFRIEREQHYLINPIYRYKFGLQPRKQIGLIRAIPFLRNFLTTCVYYTISPVA